MSASASPDRDFLSSQLCKFDAATLPLLGAAEDGGFVSSLPDLLSSVILSIRAQRSPADIFRLLAQIAEKVKQSDLAAHHQTFRSLIEEIKRNTVGDALVLPSPFELSPLHSILLSFHRSACSENAVPSTALNDDPSTLLAATALVARQLDRFVSLIPSLS